MRRSLLLAVLGLAIVGCAEQATADIPRPEACQEQAHAWCARAGFDVAGCWSWYTWGQCAQHGPDGTVAADAQEACLDAIAASPTPDIEPAVCRATWN